jgi:CHAD domain-containing protein
MISIANYYRKHVNDLIKNCSILLENYTEESIYRLRLAYKRIRAVNKFIKKELNGSEFFNDQIDRLDNIYKSAGTIREIQVSLKSLNNYGKKPDKSFDEFSMFLNNKIATVNSVLRELLMGIDIDDIKSVENKIYEHIAGTDESIVFRKAVKFIKRKTGKIDTLVFDKTDKDRYHAIRTNIKEVLFFLKILNTKKEKNKVSFKSDYLKTVGIKLGDWHDNEILLDNLHDYLKSNKSIANNDMLNSKYQALIKTINHEQSKRLKNIDRKIIKTNLDLLYLIEIKEIELV